MSLEEYQMDRAQEQLAQQYQWEAYEKSECEQWREMATRMCAKWGLQVPHSIPEFEKFVNEHFTKYT